MADSKAPVPKFASFRPKVPSATTTPVEDEHGIKREKDKDQPEKYKKSHERRHRHEERRHQHGHRRHGSRDREDKPKEGRASQALVTADAKELSKELFENSSNFYRIDRKGDTDNLRYRSLHSYSVPAYKRIGYGAVLGAGPKERIDRTTSEDKGIAVVEPERLRQAPRGLLQKQRGNEQRILRLIRPDADRSHDEYKESFIQLPPSRKRKRRSESPIPEHGEVDYRSIEGKAKPSHQPEDPNLEYASSSDENAEEVDTERTARLRNAELSRSTREQPQDLEAWRDLIEHQRAVLGFSSGDLSVTKIRTLADIRISIYEQALDVVKNIRSRATLTLGMLEEGAKFWEAKKLASKWEEALRAYSNNTSIWTAFLSFLQSSHTEFRYERCRDEYVKCLGILSEELKGASIAALEISRILVYVFLRLTSLMRDSGYQEFANALWQSILELHFFKSAEIQGEDAITKAFEEFWESEVPRIGEAGAKGWLNYSPDQQDSPNPVTIEIDTIQTSRRLFTRFSHAEQRAAKMLVHPGRSADDAGEDDPYHIVLFNDLKPVLFPHLLRLEAKNDLIVAFLRFSCLPPTLWIQTRDHESWWFDPMLTTQTKSDVLLRHFQTTTDAVFNDSFAESSLENVEWTQNILQSLVDARPEDALLAEYFIALERYVDSNLAGKITKRLLKTRSSSLRLYNCFGILECRNKTFEAGDRIFLTAISMADTLGEQERRLKVLLYRTWIWEALRLCDTEKAIHILLHVGGSVDTINAQTFSPALELRITRWLRDGRDAMLLASELHLATLHAELLALVAYFRHDRSIEYALEAFNQMETTLVSRNLGSSPAHEHLHQAKAQLIEFHLKNVHLWQPVLIRSTLASSIKLFPNNTIFLTAYNKIGPDLNLHGPQSLLNDVVLAEGKDTIIGWSVALHTTLQRGLELGGTIHVTRATFERAVSHTGKHNLHIWTSYLSFECEQRDFKRAKSVFLRGLRELPWAKWWVILGLERLADLMGFEDARKVWSVLGERELRVHIDIEELVDEEWEKRQREREG